jgi:hypothetical protein
VDGIYNPGMPLRVATGSQCVRCPIPAVSSSHAAGRGKPEISNGFDHGA